MTKKTKGGITVSDVDQKLPQTFFVMRGQIQTAFGFTREEVNTLIGSNVFVAKYPLGDGTRARFVRSQVLHVAERWAGDEAISQRQQEPTKNGNQPR